VKRESVIETVQTDKPLEEQVSDFNREVALMLQRIDQVVNESQPPDVLVKSPFFIFKIYCFFLSFVFHVYFWSSRRVFISCYLLPLLLLSSRTAKWKSWPCWNRIWRRLSAGATVWYCKYKRWTWTGRYRSTRQLQNYALAAPLSKPVTKYVTPVTSVVFI